MNNKRNLIFSYLEAIAILMVIDDHTGTHINILANVFPYNSFYMPLFVFISGYFYKNQGVIKNIQNKIKHLFVPYMIYCLIGNAIAYLLEKCNIAYWHESINGKNIGQWITVCPPSTTSAAWFAIMLIWVAIAYNIVRGVFRGKDKKIEYILLIMMVCVGWISVYLCMQGYNQNLDYLPWLRMLFYIQFYHCGVMFKKYWEPYVQRLRTDVICGICVLTNLLLIDFYSYNISFPSSCWMGNFKYWYLPIFTSITGILFWYKIMQLLSNKIGNIKIIDILAENTFLIMEIHLFFINIPNFYSLYKMTCRGISNIEFDRNLFESTPWIGANGNIFSFFTGLIGSLIFVYIMKLCKVKMYKKFERKKFSLFRKIVD